MRRRLITIVSFVLLLSLPLAAQTFPAQIQQFWNDLRLGIIAFSTGRVQANGYMNFGSTVGTNGYGFRDSSGTMQFKNFGGAWAAFLSSSGNPCPGDGTTYIAQVATNDLGLFTNGMACASGVKRFDVSATAVTSAVRQLWASASASSPNGYSNKGFYDSSTNGLGVSLGGGLLYEFNSTGVDLLNGARLRLTSSGFTPDIYIRPTASKTVTLDADGLGGALTLVDVKGPLTASAAITGAPFTTTGSGMAVANVGANSCGTTAATIAGNNNAFVITVGATSGSQCRVTFTVAAANEWDCVPVEQTTAGIANVKVTPVNTTHVDFFGAFTAGDKVTGVCFPR